MWPFASFSALSFGFKASIIGAALLAVVGSGWAIHHSIYESGWKDAIESVAAKNKVALDAVEKATGKVDACAALGRAWDTTRGLCE